MRENKKKKKSYALEVSLIIMAVIAAFVVQKFVQSADPPELPDLDGERRALATGSGNDGEVLLANEEELDKVPESYVGYLSDLGVEPDWSLLDRYQFTIEKEDFVRLLDKVYTIGGEWKRWVELGDDYAVIRTHAEDESMTYQLHFANEERREEVVKYWRERDSIKHLDKDLPLEGGEDSDRSWAYWW